MKLTVITFLVFSIYTLGFGQNVPVVEIEEVERAMSQGNNPGIQASIPEGTEKVAKDVWMKISRNYKAKTKFNKKTLEIFADNARIEAISANTVDIYTTIAEFKAEDRVAVTFWFDMGGNYLNRSDNPERIEEGLNIVRNYAKQVSVAMAEIELKNETGILKDLEGDLKSLEKQNARYQNRIEDAEKLILEMKGNIERNIADQKSKNTEIENQKSVVNEVQTKLVKIKS